MPALATLSPEDQAALAAQLAVQDSTTGTGPPPQPTYDAASGTQIPATPPPAQTTGTPTADVAAAVPQDTTAGSTAYDTPMPDESSVAPTPTPSAAPPQPTYIPTDSAVTAPPSAPPETQTNQTVDATLNQAPMAIAPTPDPYNEGRNLTVASQSVSPPIQAGTIAPTPTPSTYQPAYLSSSDAPYTPPPSTGIGGIPRPGGNEQDVAAWNAITAPRYSQVHGQPIPQSEPPRKNTGGKDTLNIPAIAPDWSGLATATGMAPAPLPGDTSTSAMGMNRGVNDLTESDLYSGGRAGANLHGYDSIELQRALRANPNLAQEMPLDTLGRLLGLNPDIQNPDMYNQITAGTADWLHTGKPPYPRGDMMLSDAIANALIVGGGNMLSPLVPGAGVAGQVLGSALQNTPQELRSYIGPWGNYLREIQSSFDPVQQSGAADVIQHEPIPGIKDIPNWEGQIGSWHPELHPWTRGFGDWADQQYRQQAWDIQQGRAQPGATSDLQVAQNTAGDINQILDQSGAKDQARLVAEQALQQAQASGLIPPTPQPLPAPPTFAPASLPVPAPPLINYRDLTSAAAYQPESSAITAPPNMLVGSDRIQGGNQGGVIPNRVDTTRLPGGTQGQMIPAPGSNPTPLPPLINYRDLTARYQPESSAVMPPVTQDPFSGLGTMGNTVLQGLTALAAARPLGGTPTLDVLSQLSTPQLQDIQAAAKAAGASVGDWLIQHGYTGGVPTLSSPSNLGPPTLDMLGGTGRPTADFLPQITIPGLGGQATFPTTGPTVTLPSRSGGKATSPPPSTTTGAYRSRGEPVPAGATTEASPDGKAIYIRDAQGNYVGIQEANGQPFIFPPTFGAQEKDATVARIKADVATQGGQPPASPPATPSPTSPTPSPAASAPSSAPVVSPDGIPVEPDTTTKSTKSITPLASGSTAGGDVGTGTGETLTTKDGKGTAAPSGGSSGGYTKKSSGSSGGYSRGGSSSSYGKKKSSTSPKSFSQFWEGFPFGQRPNSPIRQKILDAIAASLAKSQSKKRS